MLYVFLFLSADGLKAMLDSSKAALFRVFAAKIQENNQSDPFPPYFRKVSNMGDLITKMKPRSSMEQIHKADYVPFYIPSRLY